MEAITRDHKKAAMFLALVINQIVKKQQPQEIGSIFNFKMLQPFWMTAITRNYKNGCHGLTIKDRDLQQKLTVTKIG